MSPQVTTFPSPPPPCSNAKGPAPGHRGCPSLALPLPPAHTRPASASGCACDSTSASMDGTTCHSSARSPQRAPSTSPPLRTVATMTTPHFIKVAPHPHTVHLPSEQVLATPAASGRRLWGQLANGGVTPQLRRLRSDREFQVHQLLVPPTLGLVIRFVRGPLTAHHVGVALAPTQLCGQL